MTQYQRKELQKAIEHLYQTEREIMAATKILLITDIRLDMYPALFETRKLINNMMDHARKHDESKGRPWKGDYK